MRPAPVAQLGTRLLVQMVPCSFTAVCCSDLRNFIWVSIAHSIWVFIIKGTSHFHSVILSPCFTRVLVLVCEKSSDLDSFIPRSLQARRLPGPQMLLDSDSPQLQPALKDVGSDRPTVASRPQTLAVSGKESCGEEQMCP